MFESVIAESDWTAPAFSAYENIEMCGFGVDVGFHGAIPDIFHATPNDTYTSSEFPAFPHPETDGFLSLSSPGDSGVELCELASHPSTSNSPFQDTTSPSVSSTSSSPVEFASWHHPHASTMGVNFQMHHGDTFQENFTNCRKRPLNDHLSTETMVPGVSGYFYIPPMPNDITGSKPKRRRVQNVRQRKAANVRERKRMFSLNEAFDTLKHRVPTFSYEKRLSRIETLRLAITYISFMSDVLDGKQPNEINLKGLDSCDPNSTDNSLSLEDLELLKTSIASSLTPEDTDSSDSCLSSS